LALNFLNHQDSVDWAAHLPQARLQGDAHLHLAQSVPGSRQAGRALFILNLPLY
jgi:hypothetical protein